jgi:hypothetical protein
LAFSPPELLLELPLSDLPPHALAVASAPRSPKSFRVRVMFTPLRDAALSGHQQRSCQCRRAIRTREHPPSQGHDCHAEANWFGVIAARPRRDRDDRGSQRKPRER